MISIPPVTRLNLMVLIREKTNLLLLLNLSLENWKKKNKLSTAAFRISTRGSLKVSMRCHLLIECLSLAIWDTDLSSDLPSKQVQTSLFSPTTTWAISDWTSGKENSLEHAENRSIRQESYWKDDQAIASGWLWRFPQGSQSRKRLWKLIQKYC